MPNRSAAVFVLLMLSRCFCTELSKFTIKEKILHTDLNSLIDAKSDTSVADFGTAGRRGDSIFTSHPRDEILDNFDCRSLSDSYPICSTFVDLGDSIVNLEKRFGITRPKFYQNQTADVSDEQLKQYFESNAHRVESVMTKKYEEIDRGWAFFEGFYVGLPAFIGGALLELLYSKTIDGGYDWRVPCIVGAGTFVGFSGYWYVKMDTHPKCEIYNIKVLKIFSRATHY